MVIIELIPFIIIIFILLIKHFIIFFDYYNIILKDLLIRIKAICLIKVYLIIIKFFDTFFSINIFLSIVINQI